MTLGRFKGKIALVTGAGSGIGRGVALRLASEGALVILHGRTRSKLDETAALIPAPSEIEAADITDYDSNRRIAEGVGARHGHLDILVNSAGEYSRGPVEETSPESIAAMMDSNFTGMVDLTRQLTPWLRASPTGGTVVNISSTLGLAGVAGTVAYSAAKAAVVSATGVMAAEWGPGIRVNCVCAGFVDTPMLRGRGDNPEVRKFLDRLAPMHPMRRIGRPEDVAAATAFLASEEAAWITGATLVVDGGFRVAGQ